MRGETVIKVNNLSKAYKLYDSPVDRVKETFSPFRKIYHRPFHALRDISLEIHRGETVGIVGRNGSGKSTLLQLICGILQPTAGGVEVNGRISALLELGAGFNQQFTGRQNVYLNGSILGLSREEVDEHLDDILAFADIGEFIDQPVKSYSSGMYVRLAFAVAISIEPDILVVDEALSVGDEAFQRKCFAHINRIQESDRTILFVSHSASSIIDLCNRAMLFENGELLLAGAPKQVVSRYQKMLFATPDHLEEMKKSWRETPNRFELPDYVDVAQADDGETGQQRENDSAALDNYYDPGLVPASTVNYQRNGAEIREPVIVDAAGNKVNVLRSGQKYYYCYNVYFEVPAENPRFGMLIKTIKGVEITGCSAPIKDAGYDTVEAGALCKVKFPFTCNLNPGIYFLNAAVITRKEGEEIFMDRQLDIAMFRVNAKRRSSSTAMVDLVEFPEVSLVEE